MEMKGGANMKTYQYWNTVIYNLIGRSQNEETLQIVEEETPQVVETETSQTDQENNQMSEMDIDYILTTIRW